MTNPSGNGPLPPGFYPDNQGISHFPDPQIRRYAQYRSLGRPTATEASQWPVDNRREP